MPKTAVGLFENPGVVEKVVEEIEALGFPRHDVRVVEEPASFEVAGVMSFPRVDYEVDLMRELTRIGASKDEAGAYVEGLRRGGALVFATGADDKLDAAAAIMNRQGAVEIEELAGSERHLPRVSHQVATAVGENPIQTGRILQSGGGAGFFVW